MKNYDVKSALAIILQAAKDYDHLLKDRHFLIIYRKQGNFESCCVGFRGNGTVDIPVTLYNENIKTLSNPTCKVLAIFRKMYHANIFNECTYLSNGYKIEAFPEIIKQRLDPKLYES